jgi:hypothetical protein
VRAWSWQEDKALTAINAIATQGLKKRLACLTVNDHVPLHGREGPLWCSIYVLPAPVFAGGVFYFKKEASSP